jgi:hypothetical protein
MTTPRRVVALTVGTLALGLVASCTLEQVLLGQWYTLQTIPQGTCPALEWHFVVDAHRSIGGYLDRDQFKQIGLLSGTLNPDDSFQMWVTQIGGGRKESVTGRFTSQYVTLSLDGTWICEKQTLRVWLPRGLGGGGGGGGGG